MDLESGEEDERHDNVPEYNFKICNKSSELDTSMDDLNGQQFGEGADDIGINKVEQGEKADDDGEIGELNGNSDSDSEEDSSSSSSSSSSSASSSSSSSSDEDEDKIDQVLKPGIPSTEGSLRMEGTNEEESKSQVAEIADCGINQMEIDLLQDPAHKVERCIPLGRSVASSLNEISREDSDSDNEEEDSLKEEDEEDEEDGSNKEGPDEENNRDDEEYNDSDESEPDESSEEIDEDELNEIDDLLEQGLPESQRTPKRKKNLEEQSKRLDCEYNEKEIVVLEEKGKNTFEVLPGGWIEVRHCSGMPLYLHRKTRVCTLAKPYFLGPGSVRRHSIPLSAIPCLAYRRALADEEKDKTDGSKKSDKAAAGSQNEILPSEGQTSPIENKEDNQRNENCHEDLPQKEIRAKCPINGITVDFINPLNKPDICKSDNSSRKRKWNDDSNVKQRRKKLVCLETNNVNNQAAGVIDERNHESATTTEVEGVLTIAEENKPPVSKVVTDNSTVPEDLTESTYGINMLPLAKVATAKENNSMYSITPGDLREYCKSLFNFKSVKCKRFKTWSARRKHTKEQKRLQLQRPSLPEGVKLITFPVHNGGGAAGDNGKGSKEYIMNPQGKSSVCILHEYVQHALRKQPSYIFRELENASTPYAATVVINSMQYGTGYGSSKKQAKADAAKATLEILIPQMREQLDGKKGDSDSECDFISFFQPFGLMEHGIAKWCKNFSEPPPYGLLLTCLQRNFGQGKSSNVKFDMISTGNQSNKFQMQVGNHCVEVTAANKREGKQLASQSLLAKLHPNIHNFGAFIKLYGNSSIKSVKEKKQEEQQITTLQSKASANSPNWAILSKLKEEMQKLVVNKGKELALVVFDGEVPLAIMENESPFTLTD